MYLCVRVQARQQVGDNREFRAAGTPVRGSERSTTIVRTGPYRFSRNPIYLSVA